MSTHSFDVDPADPHNDQMAAATADDLSQQIRATHDLLDQVEAQDHPLTTALAVMATAFTDDVEAMSRPRMASLLSLALVHLAALERTSS